MHNRQSGAAHVPIMFFLILLVMFLGALGFGYITQTKNGDLIKERNDARSELALLKQKDLLVEHYVSDTNAVIGKPGVYDGRKSARDAGLYGPATITFNGVMNPQELKELMTNYAGQAGVAEGSSFELLLTAMVSKIKMQDERIKTAEKAQKDAVAAQEAIDRKFDATTKEASSTAKTTAQNLEQASTDWVASTTEKDKNISTLTESLRAKADELTTAREEALAREKDLKGQIGLLKTHLSALVERQKLSKPPEVADGKVLVARNGIPTAYINLGRKDMLQPGTVFRVQSANSNSVKGYGQVTSVEDERAEVRLYDFVDPIGDYARQGDLLYNDIFTPRVTRTMYLMGRFSAPYQKEQLANLLRRLGNKVVNKMGPGVDTVVLGNDPVNEEGDGFASIQESEEFKLANELRVEFTYLAKIADLIKL